MKRIIIRTLWLLVFWTTVPVFAQSLSELIHTALANNYQVLILQNDMAIATNNNTIGNAGQLPSVIATGGISAASNNTHQELADGSIKQGNNAQTSNMNFALLANWTVFDGFGVYAAKDRLEYLEQMGELNTKFYIEQTIADIIVAYYQLVYEKKLLANYRLSLAISGFRLKLEERRKSVGAGKMTDYGQALVDYNTDSIRYMGQQNNIVALQIELNRIINADLEAQVAISDTTFSFGPVLAKDSLFSQVERNSTVLDRQRLAELITESEVRMEKSNRYPVVHLFGGYQYNQNQAEIGFIQLNRNVGPVVGLNVSFNLYNGGMTNTAIKNALILEENAQLQTRDIQKNLHADVLKLYNEYASLADRISLAGINVETMQKVYAVAADQLAKGDINGYDFRLTQLSLLHAQVTLMELQFALKLVEVNLGRISGTLAEAYL